MSQPVVPIPRTNAQRRDAAESSSRDGLPSGSPSLSRMLARPLTLPFDAYRTMYDRAVQLGLVRRSLLANAFFENILCATERMALGPWARRV